MTKESIIEILNQILQTDDMEIKNYAIESLIESLEESDEMDTNERTGSK